MSGNVDRRLLGGKLRLDRIIVWRPRPFDLYLAVVSVLGAALIVLGLGLLPSYEPMLNFGLLVVLAVLSGVATTTARVGERSSITYEVHNAVSIAAVPFFGPAAGSVVIAAASLSMWLLKPADKATWKRSPRQLLFNTGMYSIAIFVAGSIWLWATSVLGSDNILGATIPWLLAAIAYGQVNLWLLLSILYLQQGQQLNIWHTWKDNLWALSIDGAIMSFGGGLLALAVRRFDALGIIMFYLPIVVSAYAFRLYVRQMQAHMDNLENIIAERTGELAQRTEELAELNREKDAFLAVLTHDMKTPLASIQLYGELIEKQPEIIIKKPQFAGVILQSQKTLLEIVNNILDLEKLQSGDTLPMEKESLDLVHLLEVTSEMLKVQAQKKEINLCFEARHQPIVADVDRQQMERVFMNLISNAVKYTPDAGQVKIAADVVDGLATVEIQDTGYGIPADELPHIFERFRRVSKHKKIAAGTGLGLAITKAIVEAHGGKLSVVSEEQVGSTFTIHLPLSQAL